MYAVVRIGSHQYIAKPGEKIKVQKIEAPVGSEIDLSEVLMISTGDKVQLKNIKAVVKAVVLEQDRDKKIEVYKKIRRHGYEKTIGHRQPFTVLAIKGIEA